MISVSGRKWKEEKVSKRLLEKIEQEYNFSKIVSKLIVSRNFDKQEIYSINNNLELSNYFLKCFYAGAISIFYSIRYIIKKWMF